MHVPRSVSSQCQDHSLNTTEKEKESTLLKEEKGESDSNSAVAMTGPHGKISMGQNERGRHTKIEKVKVIR